MCDISKQGGSGDEAQPEDERIEKLIDRYQAYEAANEELHHMLSQWDRTSCVVYKKHGDIPEEDPNAGTLFSVSALDHVIILTSQILELLL